MPNIIDITGDKYGYLTVIRRSKKKKNRVFWRCRCKCGNFVNVESYKLRTGHTRSCGCYAIEKATERSYKHGKRNYPEYGVWARMKDRCLNPNHKYYHNYGGRGIKICKRWRDSFENFFEDMGKRPYRVYSIDRIDNNGDYEPSNCRWANPALQSRNRRDNRMITFNDETKCLTDWAIEMKMPVSTLCSRLNRGWKIENAIMVPVRKAKH